MDSIMHVLLILPCNSGAKLGNYYEGRNWQVTVKKMMALNIPKKLVTLAAVDSIITFYNPSKDRETLGSIVLETEMHRVAGYDSPPNWSKFTKNDFQKLQEHEKSLLVAINRIKNMFPGENSYWVIVLNIRAYKYALIAALEQAWDGQLPSHVLIVDTGESPFFWHEDLNFAVKSIKNYLSRDTCVLRSGIWRTMKTHEDYYCGKLCLSLLSVPTRYKFWERHPIWLEDGTKLTSLLQHEKTKKNSLNSFVTRVF